MELRLRNFQAWSEARLELRGLTSVVGDSSLGKSSFARAIRKAVRNELMPNNIKLTTPKASIHFLYKGLDLLVERGAKTKDTSVYTVNGQVYEKLGGDIPQEVKDVAFGPVEVNGTSIDPCFAGQFDSQFLVGAKPAELNAVLNAFASTEKLDRGRKAMASRVGDINAQAKALAPQISVLEEQASAVETQINLVAEPMTRVMILADQVQRQTKARGVFQAYVDAWADANRAAGLLREVGRAEGALTRTVAQFKTLNRCSIVKTTGELITARGLQVQQLGAVDGATDKPLRLLRATEALRRLQAAHVGTRRTQEHLTALEAITPALNRSMIIHKARVRVKAVVEANPEPIRALLQQVHELPVAQPSTLMKVAIILQKLQGTQATLGELQQNLNTVATEVAALESERDAIEAEIEEARKTGVLTICPKCGHEFTHAH